MQPLQHAHNPMAIFKKTSKSSAAGKSVRFRAAFFRNVPAPDKSCPKWSWGKINVSVRAAIIIKGNLHRANPNLLDPETFVEMDADRGPLTCCGSGMATYHGRLKKYHESTGLLDAVVTGHGILDGYKVAIAVMDFGFSRQRWARSWGENYPDH